MVGVRADFRYQFRASNNINSRNAFVNVDADSDSLVLNGQTNTEPAAASTAATFNLFIPPASGRPGKNVSARGVQVEYTDTLPAGISSPLVWIVVFQIVLFNNYQVGQTGTLKELPVTCIAKFDGRPTVTGAFGV